MSERCSLQTGIALLDQRMEISSRPLRRTTEETSQGESNVEERRVLWIIE